MFYGNMSNPPSTSQPNYEWLAISTSAANQVYNGAVHYPGPFQPQFNNVAGGYPDISNIKF